MSNCTFTNDNNVVIKLPEHEYSDIFSTRDNHEVMLRRIVTTLINNNLINGNIIDTGAWIGDNTIPWAKNIKHKVYSIDPSPKNCEFIKTVCALNDITNVEVICNALSDKKDIISTNDDMFHCMFANNANGKTVLTATTIDDLVKENKIESYDFMHLDVEGMEFKVIKGAIESILKYEPIILFEQHITIDNYVDIVKYLNARQYRVFMINEILPGCRPDCRNLIAFPSLETLHKVIIDILSDSGIPSNIFQEVI